MVDLHSITTPFEPEVLRESTLSVAAWLFATGLDPQRSTVFVQSHVQAHAEAAWLLSAVTSFGELRRMTQFKERAEEQEFVSSGLFNYPVLMAGDILLYQTDIVPIGDDQRQHSKKKKAGRRLRHVHRDQDDRAPGRGCAPPGRSGHRRGLRARAEHDECLEKLAALETAINLAEGAS